MANKKALSSKLVRLSNLEQKVNYLFDLIGSNNITLEQKLQLLMEQKNTLVDWEKILTGIS